MIFAINFMLSGVLSFMVIVLQIIPQTMNTGNKLRWWFCLSPAYCVVHGIIFSSSSAFIYAVQPDYPQGLWAWWNLGGDAAFLVFHFIFGLLFLMVVETDIFAFLQKLTVWSIPHPNEALALDEDVLAEEERVKHQKPRKP